MSPITSLGTFLTLSFLLPGVIIFSGLILLFPDSYVLVQKRSNLELIALVLVISFLNGHLAFLFEIYLINYLWSKTFPSLRLRERSAIMAIRSQVLASAEANNISHLHFDVIFGEFILYTNTSFWILIMGLVKIFISKNMTERVEAVVVILGAVIVLMFTSPFFKHQSLSALEVIQEMNEKRNTKPASETLELKKTDAKDSEKEDGDDASSEKNVEQSKTSISTDSEAEVDHGQPTNDDDTRSIYIT